MSGLSPKGEFPLGGAARSAKGAPVSVEREALDEVLSRHGRDPHALVQILRETQDQTGWLSRAVLAVIARELNTHAA